MSLVVEPSPRIEPRYVEVSIKLLSSVSIARGPARSAYAAQVSEERSRWSGSGPTIEEALAELARATATLRPSWVRPGLDLEVVVRLPAGAPAVAGLGYTVGLAIQDAADRRASAEAS